MAGNFPGTSGAQQQDINGKPLVGAILSVFIGGTTILANTFQDIGLAIPAPNPLVADASGRIPLFFVADGTYRVRLTDQFGSTANGGYDYPQVPSIGASSSGGGGSAVDPTTILSTGDIKWQPIDNVLAGFVRSNGRTIGSATSGASERANADTQALYIYLYAFPDAICPVVGGRGANALADFNANKAITLIDMRFCSPIGLATMGNADSGRGAGVPFTSGNATTPGSFGGEGTHALIAAEVGIHTHPITDVTHTHTVPMAVALQAPVGGGQLVEVSGGTTATSASLTGITATNANSGGSVHNNTPFVITGTFFVKL